MTAFLELNNVSTFFKLIVLKKQYNRTLVEFSIWLLAVTHNAMVQLEIITLQLAGKHLKLQQMEITIVEWVTIYKQAMIVPTTKL